jgi:hypothetical protein
MTEGDYFTDGCGSVTAPFISFKKDTFFNPLGLLQVSKELPLVSYPPITDDIE